MLISCIDGENFKEIGRPVFLLKKVEVCPFSFFVSTNWLELLQFLSHFKHMRLQKILAIPETNTSFI